MPADATGSCRAFEEAREPGAVGVHAHAVPPGFVEVLRRDGSAHDVEVVDDGVRVRISIAGRLTPPLDPLLLDLAARTETMDRQGVARQVLSPWMELTPWPLEPADALWFARDHNDALAALAASSGGRRLDSLAMVPLHAAQAAARELDRALDSLTMAGAEVATSLDGLDIGGDELRPFLQVAARRRAVLLHPFRPLGGERASAHRLGDVVGNPAESTLAVGRLVLRGALRELPDLRICVVHGGGFVPYQAGRMAALAQLDTSPWPAGWVGEDLSKLYFDSLTHSQRSLRWLVEFAGTDHVVVVGGDYPFPTGSADPAAAVRECAGLSPAERDAVLRGTAGRLLADVRR